MTITFSPLEPIHVFRSYRSHGLCRKGRDFATLCIGRLFQRRGKKALSTLVFRQEFGTDSLIVNERKILNAENDSKDLVGRLNNGVPTH